MRTILYIIIVLISVMCFISCRSVQYIPVESVRTEYRTRDSIRHDSIYERDSVYMLIKGDTVMKYQYRYQYKYLYINKTDTVLKSDSIRVPYPVEKQLTKWQSMKQELGGWAFGVLVALLLGMIGYIVYRIIRR